jgi:succinate dehydrogenase / fumarate reductase, cytochrome b subunit
MTTLIEKPRPIYLDLLRIRLPVTAILSIAHRISGVLLFLAIPLVLYLLQLSLQGPEGFARVQELFGHRTLRLLGAVLFWAYVHHLLAGIRFLLLDLDIGIELAPARKSAWVVNIAAGVAFLIALGVWW